jgi:hypothetical protein
MARWRISYDGYSWGLAMAAYQSESVVQFASAAKSTTSAGVDQLDSAGQTILQLLNKAANVAEQNSKHAIDMAQKLAHELRIAQQRIRAVCRLLAIVGRAKWKTWKFTGTRPYRT